MGKAQGFANIGGISGASGGPIAPLPAAFVSVTVVDGAPDASGNPQKKVTVVYTPPSPLGTFAGLWVYLDAPDSSGGLSVADGTVAADGTTGASGSFAPIQEGFYPWAASNLLVNTNSAAPISAGFQTVTPVSMLNIAAGMLLTIDTGTNQEQVTVTSLTIVSGNATAFEATFANSHATAPVAITSAFANQIQFLQAAPTQPQYWRVYIVPGSVALQVFPVEYGLAGATPSEQVYISPPAGGTTGTETCPNVLNAQLSPASVWPMGWVANPNIVVAASGDQYFEYQAQWDWPTQDQNYQKLGGVNLILFDGLTQTYIGDVATGAPAPYVSPQLPVRVGTYVYKLYLLSFDVNGNSNSLVSGVTPEIDFTVTRNIGPAGEEYCSVVLSDGVHPFVTAAPAVAADGTAMLQVDGYWMSPTDPAFAGAEIVVLKPDTKYYTVVAGRSSPIEQFIAQPASVQSWTFYLRSIDINGLRNSIQPGVTPSVTISVGSALGQLNLTKVMATTFSNQFVVTAGAFTITQLNAGTIIAGQLQVGGGGSRVSSIRVFDSLGSLLGYIGQGIDSGYSGFNGGWLKTLYVGGSSPANAPLVTDSNGNMTISAATLGAVTVAIGFAQSGISISSSGTVSAAYTHETVQITYGSSQARLSSGAGSGAFVQIYDGTNSSTMTSTSLAMTALPSSNPGAGSKQFWYDPSDSDRVKFAA